VVKRYKKSNNDKEVYIELTARGRDVYNNRKKLDEKSLTPLLQEINKHPSDKIEFLINMFQWIDEYLSCSMVKMKAHANDHT